MNFLYPTFLFALGAAAIPVIIHLFDLQRPKKILFTNVELLRNINEKTRSSRRVKHLLVLLCRILFVVFLVLAFAQPFIKGSDNEAISTSQSVAVYIDNSLSMQNEEGSQSLLDKSVATLDKIPTVFPPATQFFFLDNNFETKDRLPVTAEKFHDRATETAYSNLYRTAAQVYKRQLNGFSDYARPGQKKIFWLSDFQKNTIGDLAKLDVDTSVHFYLLPFQNKKTSNVYVDSVWLENPFVKASEANTLKVKLSNSGENAVNNLHVKLIVDDVQSGAASVEIAPNASAVTFFDFSVKNNTPKKCQLVFEDHPVTFDNHYYFTMQVSPSVNILGISAGKQPYIASVYNNEDIFKYTENKPGNVSVSDVEKANLIIVDGFDKLNTTEADLLKKHTQKGGVLLLFPSEKPDENAMAVVSQTMKLPIAEKYQPSYTAADIAAGILFPDIKNPFFENVFEKTDKNIDMPFALPVLKMAGKGLVLLKNRQDEPFLSLFAQGKSSIYTCNTPLHEPYTNIQKHSIFVPVMYKIAINSVAENRNLAYSFNDKNVVLPVNSAQPDLKFSIQKEGFNYIPNQSQRGGQLIFDMPNVPMEAGFYSLSLHDTAQRILAINPGKSESQMDFYSPEELKEMFAGKKNVTVFENEIGESFIAEYKEKHLGIALWKYCLLAALFFLLMEILLIRFTKG